MFKSEILEDPTKDQSKTEVIAIIGTNHYCSGGQKTRKIDT